MINKIRSSLKAKWFVLYILLIIASFFMELYFIVNLPDDYVALFGVGIINLIACYLIIDTVICNVKDYYNEKNQEKEFINVQKDICESEKENLCEINESIKLLKKSIEDTNNEMMKINKAIAKTMIKKNIELVEEIKYTINNRDDRSN